MIATIELPDSIYEQVKAHAAQQGTSIDEFLVEAVRDKLGKEQDQSKTGLMSVFGKGDKRVVAEIQRVIDGEFSKIDPDQWK